MRKPHITLAMDGTEGRGGRVALSSASAVDSPRLITYETLVKRALLREGALVV